MNNPSPSFDAIAGLTDMAFQPVRRCERSAFSTASHSVAFEFKIDGKVYWGECHRARIGGAGYSYDSWIRSLDRNNRSYAIAERALPAVRTAIAAHVAGMVKAYARAIDDAPAAKPAAPAVQVESPRFLYIVLKGDKGASYLCEGGVYSTHPQGEYAGNTLERARLDVDALNSRYLGAADKPYRLVASPAGLELDGVVRSSLEQWQLDALDVVAPVQVVAPAARAIPGKRPAPVRPSDPLRRALVAEGRMYSNALVMACENKTGKEFRLAVEEWRDRLADFRARLGWYWSDRVASKAAR